MALSRNELEKIVTAETHPLGWQIFADSNKKQKMSDPDLAKQVEESIKNIREIRTAERGAAGFTRKGNSRSFSFRRGAGRPHPYTRGGYASGNSGNYGGRGYSKPFSGRNAGSECYTNATNEDTSPMNVPTRQTCGMTEPLINFCAKAASI